MPTHDLPLELRAYNAAFPDDPFTVDDLPADDAVEDMRSVRDAATEDEAMKEISWYQLKWRDGKDEAGLRLAVRTIRAYPDPPLPLDCLPFRVHRLNPAGILPTKAHAGDLGFDLATPFAAYCPAGQVTPIPLRIACGFPPGMGGLILGRSGLAKDALFPIGGVIDGSYVGEILVLLMNASGKGKTFAAGDRIAQLVLVPVVSAVVVEVDGLDVAETTRGSDGFGSTGA